MRSGVLLVGGQLGRGLEGQGGDLHRLLDGVEGQGVLALGQVEDQRRAGAAVVVLQVDGLLREDFLRIGADLVVVLQRDVFVPPDALEDDLRQGLIGRLAVQQHAALDIGGGAGQGHVADFQVVETFFFDREGPGGGADVAGVGGIRVVCSGLAAVDGVIAQLAVGYVQADFRLGQRIGIAVAIQVGLIGGFAGDDRFGCGHGVMALVVSGEHADKCRGDHDNNDHTQGDLELLILGHGPFTPFA